MTAMRKPNGRSSYAWARHLEASPLAVFELSEAAQKGLDYAQALANDAYRRSLDPRPEHHLEPLTLHQLAEWNEVDPAYVARRIAEARRQLFGDLSDAAIYKRAQRLRGRRPRSCAEPGCHTLIPITDPANKNYCNQHASGAARIARHRRKPLKTPAPRADAA